MMALVSGRSQRSSSTGVAVSSTQTSSAMPRYLTSTPPRRPRCRSSPAPRAATCQMRGAVRSGGRHASRRLDHDVLERRVLVALARPGVDSRNPVDDVHAFTHAAEHRVTEVARAVVEKGVVGEVDEELRGGAVDVAGARHRQTAAGVLQSVLRLVADRRARLLAGEVGGEAAALDDEARHDAMKDRAVEVALIDVAQEILDREWRLLREQLDREGAVGSFKADHIVLP